MQFLKKILNIFKLDHKEIILQVILYTHLKLNKMGITWYSFYRNKVEFDY